MPTIPSPYGKDATNYDSTKGNNDHDNMIRSHKSGTHLQVLRKHYENNLQTPRKKKLRCTNKENNSQK